MGGSDRVDGRIVLITGSSSGVGRRLALQLAARGARVVCCARRRAALENLVLEIERAGGCALAVRCDVEDAAAIVRAFDEAEAHFGPVEAVIANAGINHAQSALRLDVSALDSIISVNLRAAFLTAQEGARRMIAKGVAEDRRRIVFISSILGTRPMPGAAIYAATKAGVIMLTKGLALEWSRHSISVNAICPGFMPTEIIDEWFETEPGRVTISRWPLGRFMPVDDLLPPLLFLLSPAARATTGTSIVVDEAQSLA